MFKLYANKNNLMLLEREQVTSGSVNVCQVRFDFSGDWNGLDRTAVFRCGGESVSVLLDESGECTVPWEVLQKPGFRLEAGVYGTQGGEVVLPTVWASLGTVLTGVNAPEGRVPPTPELWRQALARKGDRLDYTDKGLLGLYAGENLLSAVPVAGEGGEGGVSDHRFLTGRDLEDQHPIKAIEGLSEELRRIPAPAEALTNQELEELLK